MHVILVRHGRAETGHANPERPLTREGKRNIEILGQFFARQSEQVNQIWHSGILRAQQTAEILAEYIPSTNGLIQMQNCSPNSDPKTMHIALNAEKHDIMLVSHLPFLEYLANLMIAGNMEAEMIHFPPGGAAKLVKTDETWNETWIVTPDTLQNQSHD